MTPLERILGRLPDVKKNGDGWVARCPAHEDRKPSLRIRQGDDGRVLVKCMAGCETTAVLGKLGLVMADLFPDTGQKHGQPSAGVVARYDYVDEQGELLFQVERKADKQFLQRRPDGNGGWIYKLDGTRRVLYRLPELPTADAAQWVFCPEGEKDVDNLRALGLVATCNPGGAGKWRSEYGDALRGRRVCILPDNDEAGEKHAQQVWADLKGKAADARVLRLPNLPSKGDVSDWLNTHDGAEPEALAAQLIDMAEKAPAGAPAAPHTETKAADVAVVPQHRTAVELLQENPELNPPVLEGLLREAELLNLISASKIGKSWLTLSLALSVVTGRAWLGRFPVTRGEVLLIDNELHASTLAGRIHRVSEAMPVDLVEYGPALHIEVLRGRLQNLHTMGVYFDAIEPGRYRLIILDAFYRFLPPGTDENSNADMCGLFNILDAHAQRLRSAFVLVHHSSKGLQSEKAITDVGSGAGAMSRATDTHLVLRPHEQDDAVVIEAAVRSWKPLLPFCLRWEFPLWHVAEDLDPADLRRPARRGTKAEERPKRAQPTPAEFVSRYVTHEPRDKVLIVAKAAQDGMSERLAGRMLTLATADGLIYRWPQERTTAPFRYATREPDLLSEGVKP